MGARIRVVFETLVVLIVLVGTASAQVSQPRWTPVTQATQLAYVTQKPEGISSAPTPSWPYYTDSPLFANPTTGSSFVTTPYSVPVNVFPQQPAVSQPPALVQQPTYQPPVAQQPVYQQPVVQQPVYQQQPMVQQPVAPPVIPPAPTAPISSAPQLAAQPTPQPAMTPAPMAQQPTVPQPAPQSPPTVPQGPPVVATSTQPDAPFVDNRVFQQGAKEWNVFDITGYTSRFPAGASPETGIQEWVLRKTGSAFYPGSDVARLVVTSQQVKVYHNPEVQSAVKDVLGRFLYYSPGQFRSRVQIVQTKDQDWRRDIVSRLQSISTPAGQGAWLISRNGMSEFLGEVVGDAKGTILTNEEFVVANGQGALLRWASEQTRANHAGSNVAAQGLAENPNFDGVELRFSPLIDVDAATVEVDVNALVRRVVLPKENGLLGANRNSPPAITDRQIRNLYKIPPHKLLMLSLGSVPRFDTSKGLFQREKQGEILVFIDLTPEGEHAVNGVPIASTPPVSPTPVVQTSSKPMPQRGRPRNVPHVPPVMTRAVY